MRDLFNSFLKLKGLHFLMVLFGSFVLILGFAPVENTLFGGLTLFAGLCALAIWAVNKYNNTPKD